MLAPVLVLACGNPSRGDDALGPELAAAVERTHAEAIARGELEVQCRYQLAVEDALELEGRQRVIVVDAAGSGPEVLLQPLSPRRDESFTTHRLSPWALLQVFQEIERSPLPRCELLAIRGERFELGEPLSERARANLERALDVLDTPPAHLLRRPHSARRTCASRAGPRPGTQRHST